MRKILLYTLLVYSFIIGFLGREIGGLPYMSFIEVMLFILAIAVIIKTPKAEWGLINNDVVYLFSLWFIISLLQGFNPGGSIVGWAAELRTVALYPFLIIPLAFLVFRNNKNLDVFFILIVLFSTIAALNGIKQLYIGPWPGEQRFLDGGGSNTHILWGKLRVFSFFSDAGQFGASQAHIGLMAIIVSFGPFKTWKRVLLFFCGCLMLYGMLISGTRGALFMLIVGAFTAIVLSKKFKVLIAGGILMLGFVVFLKYTQIASSNYQIYRLRSALNPEDPSLNVRFITQRNLREYMHTRPFGGGLGVIGFNGMMYNSDKYLSTVQPDSFFVKVWAMYGIVGLTIWLCMMVYILGKCCGIVWGIRDEELRIKMIALTSGFAGILFCSYGNEVINNMPSSIVIYMTIVFICISPRLESMEKSKLLT